MKVAGRKYQPTVWGCPDMKSPDITMIHVYISKSLEKTSRTDAETASKALTVRDAFYATLKELGKQIGPIHTFILINPSRIR
jgi:hypothetical protein